MDTVSAVFVTTQSENLSLCNDYTSEGLRIVCFREVMYLSGAAV